MHEIRFPDADITIHMKQFVIDGATFSTLDGFYDEISRVLIPGAPWGRNLDAFDDVLSGGFGTPKDGFEIVWRNHAVSRDRRGYAETIRQPEKRLSHCHSSNRQSVTLDLAAATAHAGPTVFDWLLEIIRDHGPDGTKAEDHVLLSLR
jgi:RNAse (barnase) inhibitor barstar